MRSYDYAYRKGVRPVSWDEYAQLASQLAEALAGSGVDIIVGIARAGLIPATTVACALRKELYPVRVSRRINDEVLYERPVWRVPVSPDVAGKVVVVLDEIADTGETLALVAGEVKRLGANQVLTAALVSHSWADPAPTFSALVTDELVIWPWDAQIYSDGSWQPHPEITAALEDQASGG